MLLGHAIDRGLFPLPRDSRVGQSVWLGGGEISRPTGRPGHSPLPFSQPGPDPRGAAQPVHTCLISAPSAGTGSHLCSLRTVPSPGGWPSAARSPLRSPVTSNLSCRARCKTRFSKTPGDTHTASSSGHRLVQQSGPSPSPLLPSLGPIYLGASQERFPLRMSRLKSGQKPQRGRCQYGHCLAPLEPPTLKRAL